MSKQRHHNRASTCRLAELVDIGFFRALGDSNRLALVSRLASCGRPCSVSELNECCPIDFSVTSRHLALLRDAGILQAEKSGKQVRYSVRFDEVITKLRAMADAIEACYPPEHTRASGTNR